MKVSTETIAMKSILVIAAISATLVALCDSHGMMVGPAGRGSRWRFNDSAPFNYEDNEAFCGGFIVQWNQNEGKCGICGDDYKTPQPRPHEIGGVYGEGVVVESYAANSIIPVTVNLTTNHWGDFTFDLCNMDDEKETDECFGKWKLKLTDGSEKYKIKDHSDGLVNTTLQIPIGIKCKHCVLRWTYRTGNNWGTCENGTAALGCGPQEHFRNCADISIYD